MSEYDFDVLYLGSGHGAFDGAGPLAASGKKVGVIESDMIGGTCLIMGVTQKSRWTHQSCCNVWPNACKASCPAASRLTGRS